MERRVRRIRQERQRRNTQPIMYKPEREPSLQDLANVGKSSLALSLPRTTSATDLTADNIQIKPANLNRSSSFSNVLNTSGQRPTSIPTDLRMYKQKWKSVCDLNATNSDNFSLMRTNSLHSLWSSERHLAPEDVGSVFTYARYRYKRGIFREYIYSFLSKKAEIVTRRRVSVSRYLFNFYLEKLGYEYRVENRVFFHTTS
ncbi:unnamed protein product [Dimorphilus gyrociliatus]|uniref:Uncharacterized protein n=1 Tax=Dimorphilus gyrociliatus TaxID=2664684 RepID=A0A7I8VBD0_9ANNE|nr:unnamed protein product [Dimorphilus gyrociliatus]